MNDYNQLSNDALKDRLRLVESVSKTGFWSYILDEDLLIWDDRMHEMYDHPIEKFEGKFSDWEDRLVPEDVEPAKSSFQKSVATNGEFLYTFRINTSKGVRYIKAAAKGVTDDTGRVVKMMGVNFDVTSDIEATAKAQKEAQLYQAFIAQSPNATAIFDTNMRYLACSEKWLRDYGLEGQDILGKSHYDIFPEITDEWKKVHQSALLGKGKSREIDSFKREDGSVQYLRWSVQPWRNLNQQIGGLIMYTEDITKRVLAEEESREIAEFFLETKKLARIGVWEVDMRTGLSKWDEVVADIYKTPVGWYPPTPEDGIAFYKEGESRQAIIDAFEKLTSEGESYDMQLQLVDSTGREVWVRTVGNPVYDDNGDLIKVSGLFQDIDKQKRAEFEMDSNLRQVKLMTERLSIQNKSLLEFAHISSHNLRSPVGNLMSLTELYNEFSEEEKPAVFEKIKTEVNRLSETLDDLIDALVIRESVAKFDQRINLEKVVAKIAESLSEQIKIADFKLHTNFSSVNEITSNATYIQSIFLNLITNAIKYRRESVKPELEIVTKKTEHEIIIQFKDNGIGIDLSKFSKKIFGLYNTFHRGYDSKGVGLFMVNAHVESLGGSIEVESILEKGTIFTVKLPTVTS